MSPGLVVKNRVKNIIPVVLWLVYILGIFLPVVFTVGTLV
jgi:hypothetical protein